MFCLKDNIQTTELEELPSQKLHVFDEFKQQIVMKINMAKTKNSEVLHILHIAATYLFKYK